MMPARTQSVSRQNLYTALAVVSIVSTFVFSVDGEGMSWLMWRDAPVLAAALVLLGVTFLVLRRRARKTQTVERR